jgi:hypothetical protein
MDDIKLYASKKNHILSLLLVHDYVKQENSVIKFLVHDYVKKEEICNNDFYIYLISLTSRDQ